MLWKIAVFITAWFNLTLTIITLQSETILENLLSGFQSESNCNYQGKIQEFVKKGAYSSSRLLKQGVWGTHSPRRYRVTLFL